jgi:hypothetical protein
MTTGESIGALFGGIVAVSLGCALLYQTKRQNVHPWFRTWWAKYHDETDSIDRVMCGVVGAGFLLVGTILFISGTYTTLL